MKNNFRLIAFLLIWACKANCQVNNPANNFTINGTVADHKIRVIQLRYAVGNNKRALLKTYVKKGKFKFKGFTASPAYAEFFFDNEPISRSDFGFNMFFLNPGVITISLVKNDPELTKVKGSVMQDDWDALTEQKKPIAALRVALYEVSYKPKHQKDTTGNDASHKKSSELFDRYNEQLKQIDFGFIKTHPNSFLSPYLMYDYFIEKSLKLDSAEIFYNSFSPAVKNSIAGKKIAAKIAAHRASAKGSFAPLFSHKDMYGKLIDLKSFRGKKYVLLYFWASWSKPERRDVPFLTKFYSKYHIKGLEIIGLSQDFFKRDWKKAISENNMNWHNILSQYDSNIIRGYNIEGMPPSILVLIDKEGKIIGRYIGDHVEWETTGDNEGNLPDLDKKLIEIWGN